MKNTIRLFVISGLLTASSFYASGNEDKINIPFRYGQGQALFEVHCSSCHGPTLKGSAKGPPLLHQFYVPSHHGDGAFYRAGLNGVKAHHWNFGDMPPVAGMTEKRMKSIIAYVRFYQRQKKLY
ncbi:MAG: cytochrome c [Gammaproteobacteria bacterium]|nr:cytochrome c [Gammaproteobacteria bacterium]